MASIRLTPESLAVLVNDWATSPDHRGDTLVFCSSVMSIDAVRSACWAAGIIATVSIIDGDLHRVSFVELLVEATI